MSCGLKNSLCPPPSTPTTSTTTPPTHHNTNNNNTASSNHTTFRPYPPKPSPILFVDGETGLWSASRTYGNYNPNGTFDSSHNEDFQNHVFLCPSGASIVFHYPAGTHDIIQLSSREQYDTCSNLSVSTHVTLLSPDRYEDLDLSSMSQDSSSSFPDVSFYYKCSLDTTNSSTLDTIEPNTTQWTLHKMEWITCSFPGHCQAGQKLEIHTVPVQEYFTIMNYTSYLTHGSNHNNENSNDDDDDVIPHVDGTKMDMEVTSLLDLWTLLHAHRDPSTGFLVMDRGYQTESLANQTLEWLWCALDHCPYTALDVATLYGLEFTRDDCFSTIYTLMGYVSRKRPIPQYPQSELYYRLAIDWGTNHTNTTSTSVLRNDCTARSYLVSMFLDKRDFDAAIDETKKLCTYCSHRQDEEVHNTTSHIFGANYSVSLLQAKYEYDRVHASWPDSVGSPCEGVLQSNVIFEGNTTTNNTNNNNNRSVGSLVRRCDHGIVLTFLFVFVILKWT